MSAKQDSDRSDHRIVILGRAGSGKTTFARRLGALMSIPVICLDEIWQSNWDQSHNSNFKLILSEMHSKEQWISDGNFANVTFDIRLPRTTLIIWIERSKISCSWRATKRVFNRNEPHHRIGKLADVLKYIWNFDRINRPIIEAARVQYGPDVLVLKLSSNLEIDSFLSSCCTKAMSITSS